MRDSFTPRLELWMNFSSPTYIPTCVTPAPGGAAILQAVPGFAPKRDPGERAPFDPDAQGPLDGELLSGRVGRDAECGARERVRAEGSAAPERLDLVAQTVERATPAQRVAHEQRYAEAVRERTAAPPQARAGPCLVNVRAIAVVPAPQMELHAAAPAPPLPPRLRRQRRRQQQQQSHPPPPR